MYTHLDEPRYLSLTTRRRDGSLASTPVWVVSDDGHRLLVWTGATTWKARRIRRDPRVLVAACTARGRERGPRLEATARILDADAVDLVVPLLRRKYGWQRRLLELVAQLHRGPQPAQAYIEITPDEEDRGNRENGRDRRRVKPAGAGNQGRVASAHSLPTRTRHRRPAFRKT
jgi:PPOX class probable F420-dependent enzyme